MNGVPFFLFFFFSLFRLYLGLFLSCFRSFILSFFPNITFAYFIYACICVVHAHIYNILLMDNDKFLPRTMFGWCDFCVFVFRFLLLYEWPACQHHHMDYTSKVCKYVRVYRYQIFLLLLSHTFYSAFKFTIR